VSQIKRRVFAAIILILLIVVPFLDWRLGAVLWMCAWLVFIFQNLYSRRNWRFGGMDNKTKEEQQE
jgi:hypothetical protein